LGSGVVKLPSGSFSPEMLTRVLNTLPIDMTVVDANDEVLYFSQSSERIFPRTTAILGRKVSNCHPPASVHIVEKILDEFKSGERDSAEFYIHLGDKYVHIRYWPIRDDEGNYMGTLEVSQDIAPIQKLKGDKRLLDEFED
jgi:PAS domain S-box-containing protein